MFKFAKYYFLLNWYQKTKRNMLAVVVFFVLFFVSTYLFGDLIAMADEKLGLVIAKWSAIIVLLVVIAFNMAQIFKAVPVPFKKEESDKAVDTRREKMRPLHSKPNQNTQISPYIQCFDSHF